MAKLSEKFGYRTALVTGASSGLGFAFAQMLQAEGLEVWAASRNPAATAKAEGWHPVSLDLADEASLRAAIAQVRAEAGAPDVLVNNAGAGVHAAFERFPEIEVRRLVQLLLEGPMMLTRAFLPDLLARRRGAVVNVSSLAAQFPIPGMSVYSAAKAGLSGFSQALMLETTGRGVQILDFQPGDYRTQFNRAAVRPEGGAEWEAKAWKRAEELLAASPEAGHAAQNLRKALRAGRSRTVATGSFFQAGFAPLGARFAGQRLTHAILQKYFNL